MTEDERVKNAFSRNDWSETKHADSLVICKVISDFVKGFEKWAKIIPCVSIFGSARMRVDDTYYKMPEEEEAEVIDTFNKKYMLSPNF